MDNGYVLRKQNRQWENVVPTSQKPKRLNPDALPGDGMAKKAGNAIKKNRDRTKNIMDSLFGKPKKKKSSK